MINIKTLSMCIYLTSFHWYYSSVDEIPQNIRSDEEFRTIVEFSTRDNAACYQQTYYRCKYSTVRTSFV